MSPIFPCQLAALELMLQGHSDTAISATLKIARRTLYTETPRSHFPPSSKPANATSSPNPPIVSAR